MSTVMTWLVILVILVLLELATMGLTTIWFAGGAFAALLLAVLGAPIHWQLTVFLLVSLLLLFFTRPIAMRYFNKNRWKSNVEGIIGKRGIVTKEIDNLQSYGQVTIAGMEWTACSLEDACIIPEGSLVKVVEIRGVKLIVEPEKQENSEE